MISPLDISEEVATGVDDGMENGRMSDLEDLSLDEDLSIDDEPSHKKMKLSEIMVQVPSKNRSSA